MVSILQSQGVRQRIERSVALPLTNGHEAPATELTELYDSIDDKYCNV